MINRNKTLLGFIVAAICTSLLSNTMVDAIVTNPSEINNQTISSDIEQNSSQNLYEEKAVNSTNTEASTTSTSGSAVTYSNNAEVLPTIPGEIPAAKLIQSDYVTVKQTENGVIALDETSSIKEKGYLKYTIKPDDGYEIKDVIVDGTSIGICQYYEFKNLTESGHTISAVFNKIEKHATGYCSDGEKIPYVYRTVNTKSKYGLVQSIEDSTYNTDISNLKFVSPVKDQGNLGVCWTFSALGTFESCLLKEHQDAAASTYDFSENNMRYAMSKDGGNKLGIDRPNDGAGSFDFALAYLTRGQMNGVVDESEDPYPSEADTHKESATKIRTPEDVGGKTVLDYYPTQVIRLGDLPDDPTVAQKEARKNEVKQLIKKYGSVTLSFYSDESYYNKYTNNGKTTCAYYNPTSRTKVVNHGVSIVGWDDNYSVDNFKDGAKPKKPGAFLVKNSWGNDWGQNGYFYLSYEDANAGSGINAFKEIKSRDFYNNLYEYDTLGSSMITSLSNNDTDVYYANVFNTKNKGCEKLSAISTYCTYPNCYIKLYVSTDGGKTFTEKSANSGYIYDDSKGYKIENVGYYTFMLDEPVNLDCDNFAVAIEVKTTDGPHGGLIPIESHYGYFKTAICEKGSYVGSSLADLCNNIDKNIDKTISFGETIGSNVGVKAFTEDTAFSKTTLENLYNSSKDLNYTDYINDSWIPFATALSNAKTILDNPNATSSEVSDAYLTLNNSKKGLVPIQASKTELEGLYNSSKELRSENYTTDSWAQFAYALSNAKKILDKTNATTSEVINAHNALSSAIYGLVANQTADKKSLESKYTELKDKIQADYTTDSWASFAAALSNAKTILDKTKASQAEVNDAYSELNSAASNLVEISFLIKLYNTYTKRIEINYTATSWAPFVAALSNAKIILDKPNASQDEVHKTFEALLNAGKNLKKVTVDKSSLESKYTELKDKIQADYTTDSWAPFATALSNAKTILDKTNAYQSEVNDAYSALDSAAKGLVANQTADKKLLASKYTELKDKIQVNYTTASWTPFAAALSNAKRILDKSDAPQAEVNDVYSVLNSAASNLVDTSSLGTIYNIYKNKIEGNYTTASWATFAAALSNAKRILDKPDSSKAEVHDAFSALYNAGNNLENSSDFIKKPLEGRYAEYKDKTQTDYTTASWSPFVAALSNAKTILDKPNASQAEVNNACSVLDSTVNSLVDTSSLNKLYNFYKNETEKYYTTDSWTAFATTLSNAKTILDKPNASKAEVHDAFSALYNSSQALTRKNTVSSVSSSSQPTKGTDMINTSSVDIKTSSSNNTISLQVANSIKGEIKSSEVIKSSGGSSVVCTNIASSSGDFKVITTGELSGSLVNNSDTISINADNNANAYIYVATLNRYLPIETNRGNNAIKLTVQPNTNYAITSQPLSLVQSGWNKIDNYWYVVNPNGSLKKGWFEDTDGHWYFLKDSGAVAYNEYIDGYYLGANGAWIS